MSKPAHLPEFEANVAELQHTHRKTIAWSRRACAVTWARVAAQTAMLAEQRKIMRHPALASDAEDARGDLAARHRIVRCLNALYSSIAVPDVDEG